MTQEQTITISKAEYLGMKQQIATLTHQLAEMKRLVFGAKRERFIAGDVAQGRLFDLPGEEREAEEEQITYTRQKPEAKKQPLRLELAPHLPRREQVIEPEDLPEGAVRIGEAITELLEYEPATIYVRRIVRPKYLVSKTDEKTEFSIAELPTLPIPKGNAGAGMLAHLLISKFVDHLPFYRQVQMFKRQDVNIAESTINGWFNASCNLLGPLYDALRARLQASDYLMADETPIAVQTKDKPGATHKGYHWVYCDPVQRLVLFDYQKTRGREGPDQMLENFRGYLQTDGYTAYGHFEQQPGITLLACMAHARRKFEHAKDNDAKRSQQALRMFGQLYDIERQAAERELGPDQIKALREEKALPILNRMQEWMREEIYKVLPKSPIGEAMAYAMNLWPRLARYTDQGRFRIDNNLIENTIRPVALGRKNYLFAGSHDAARQAGIVYSLLATCKLNHVEPFEWLKKTLEIIPDYPANQLYKLLPTQH